MLKRYIEYREMQQLRKDHLRKQNLRNLAIMASALVVLLVGTYVVKAFRPVESSQAAKPTGPSLVSQKEMQEIEEFATAVTKPMGELTKEDLDLVGAKAKDPCYDKNAQLPQEQMMSAIAKCKGIS